MDSSLPAAIRVLWMQLWPLRPPRLRRSSSSRPLTLMWRLRHRWGPLLRLLARLFHLVEAWVPRGRRRKRRILEPLRAPRQQQHFHPHDDCRGRRVAYGDPVTSSVSRRSTADGGSGSGEFCSAASAVRKLPTTGTLATAEAGRVSSGSGASQSHRLLGPVFGECSQHPDGHECCWHEDRQQPERRLLVRHPRSLAS